MILFLPEFWLVHRDLLASAWGSLRPASGQAPTQTDQKRAMSTGYYALFHYISQSCADELAGGGAKPLTRAAAQVYRSLDHRDIAAACDKARLSSSGFPKAIAELARVFDDMIKARQRADYDPASTFVLLQVEDKLREVETVIAGHAATDKDDRRAFAILVAVKSPGRGRL
jgi:hypothetical protein